MCETTGANASIASIRVEGETALPLTLTPQQANQLLLMGRVELVGQILTSSNATFLVQVTQNDLQALAIYKPHTGETPLWDFPRGTLCFREVAAYATSQTLGWPCVPPTTLREGPHGIGAIQLFIDADPEATYFSFSTELRPLLLPIALFDLLTNNADRKGGHMLLDEKNRIWAIDNALTFHPEPKLRTVIWDFAGEPIPQAYVADMRQLEKKLADKGSTLYQALDGLLAAREIEALEDRLTLLLERPIFPHPPPGRRHVPWPLV